MSFQVRANSRIESIILEVRRSLVRSQSKAGTLFKSPEALASIKARTCTTGLKTRMKPLDWSQIKLVHMRITERPQ